MSDRLVIMPADDLRALIAEAVAEGVAQAVTERRPWLTREAMADTLGGVSVEEVSRRARRGEIEARGTGKATRYRVRE